MSNLPHRSSYPPVTRRPTVKVSTDLIAVLIITGLTLLFMRQVVFKGQVLLPLDILYQIEPWKSETVDQPVTHPLWNSEISDSVLQSYPVAKMAAQLWKEGVPLWDPYPMTGMPAFGRGLTFSNPVFFAFALFLPPASALSWATVLCLWVGGLSMYGLLREIGARPFGSLVGSLAFEFGSYTLGWVWLFSFLAPMVWLPLVFWSVERAINKNRLALGTHWIGRVWHSNPIRNDSMAFLWSGHADLVRSLQRNYLICTL